MSAGPTRRSRHRRSALRSLAALGGAAAALLACSPPELERAAALEVPPLLLRGIALEGWTGAVRELSVEASQATIDLEGRVALLEQVRISLAGGEAGPLEVRSPSGEFDLARDVLWLRGGVEGQTRPGERFSTAELRFDQESGRLHSAQPVRIERPNLDLTASAMDLDLGARRLSLHGAVRAELRSK